MRTPMELFETPDNWGSETFYLSKREARRLANSLRQLGPDWATCSVRECRRWYRVCPGLYIPEGVRKAKPIRFHWDMARRSWVPGEPVSAWGRRP